jgi:hypothetical protein
MTTRAVTCGSTLYTQLVACCVASAMSNTAAARRTLHMCHVRTRVHMCSHTVTMSATRLQSTVYDDQHMSDHVAVVASLSLSESIEQAQVGQPGHVGTCRMQSSGEQQQLQPDTAAGISRIMCQNICPHTAAAGYRSGSIRTRAVQ